MSFARPLLGAVLAAASVSLLAQPKKVPSLEELEKAGAVIGEIHVRPQNIFDLEDPRENNIVFRAANFLHIVTREEPIRRALLFRKGDWLSVRRIQETERLLRAQSYLYDVEIRPVAYHDGVADLEVVTRDTWSLKPDISLKREGGKTTGSFAIEDQNILGTGASASVARVRGVDHTGMEFKLANKHAFGPWTGVDFAYSDLDTGRSQAFSLQQPFYALDVRAAAGFSVAHNESIASVYRAGAVVSEYRQRHNLLEASGGWSTGLLGSWVHRFSAGLSHQDKEYSLDPERVPPPELPESVAVTGPFLRYEVIEDDVRRLSNFDLIERPEFFDLGLHATLQVGRAMEGLGSTRAGTFYSLEVSDGAHAAVDHILLGSASVSGRRDDLAHRQQVNASVRYYRRQARDALFFASVSGAVSKSPDISDVLQLGGDNGLRGYPLRYQTGDTRWLLTLEQRVYTDWYPLRLFRVGGAVFYDVGRASGGKFDQGGAIPGWLSDFGFGLRILSTRSAFGNVMHLDLAFPTRTGPGIDPVQVLFKTRASF